MAFVLPPLNGRHTHPLTAHARSELARLRIAPIPRQEFNPGVANRLERGRLAEIVMLPSPYKTHKGKRLAHLQITAAGRAELDQPQRREIPPTLKGAMTGRIGQRKHQPWKPGDPRP